MPATPPSLLTFYVNGNKVVESNADPELTLLQYLRTKLRLTGTKLGCGEGGCGACTVMVSRFDHTTKQILHYSMNACLAPLCSMHGLAVTTVEGIGSVKQGLHPVQERLSKSHGSQCGFCTPGIIMSMYTLLRNTRQPTARQMEKAFEGNLCRCTGYRPILDGFRSFTKEFCVEGDSCCRNQRRLQQEEAVTTKLFDSKEFLPLHSSQDPIFPPELQRNNSFATERLVYRGDRITWFRPATLEELLALKAEFPDARLVVGNTEVGVEVKFKNMQYPVIIAATHAPDLLQVQHGADGITLGASVTLSRLDQELKDAVQTMSEEKTRIFSAVIEMLQWFAGHQIRNVACIGGNIITASPISDLNPLFLAAGVTLKVQSKAGGVRTLKMNETFFLGYRKTAIKTDEVLISASFPFTSKDEYFSSFKQAHRREDDIAIVNAGMRVLFEANSNIIKEMTLAYGGMAPTSVMTTKTMTRLVGKRWEDSLVPEACRLLAEDLPLSPGSPGGLVEYRRTLSTSFFFKFYLSVQLQLQTKEVMARQVGCRTSCDDASFCREPRRSCQLFQEVAPGQPSEDPVGRPIQHKSGAKQTTGEALFVDDLPRRENELYLAFVYSSKAHARILNIDASDALQQPGVVDFIGHKDVPGLNKWGAVLPDDEEFFASEEVLCQGQVIGAVLAETQQQAQRAAKCVQVDYEELDSIITIQDAIQSESFYPYTHKIECGDIDKAFAEADHVLEGVSHVGGQEHFYLETHSSLAIPGEGGEMEVISSTQSPSDTQNIVARVLCVPANKIISRVKRLGGGFGGKQSRSLCFSVPVAIAAKKHGRPVRCMLDRDEDMVSSGTRHPFMGKYKVGFTDKGKVVALDIVLYSNAGMSVDLSFAVMDRALSHCQNAYKVPNLRVSGKVCRTNIPSCTAFRGFGAPQAMMMSEQCMTDIAIALGIPTVKVREMNLYQAGDVTHYNQQLTDCKVQRCWDECLVQSDFYNRQNDVQTFNSKTRWKKRGITIVPTLYGIGLEVLSLNQAGALVHVYKDGSVLLTHGGVEMGQGLHTKMIQVASRVLRIPESYVHISETSTDRNPNTSPTAASSGSDLNGFAVMNACQTLIERLDPIIKENPKGSWEDWVKQAYLARISLSATGYSCPDNIDFDFETGSGRMYHYYTCGAACSEVEIDCLTGDHQVLRTDIVMDLGVSMNPAIDIGQIEGAFVQGYGMMMMEQQKMSPKGFLYTRGPGSYKIPGFGDIPVEFNVSLLKGSGNCRAVYSSKAVGEPPLFLSSSVFFAVKEAILSARADAGHDGNFRLNSPATPERVRMACRDQFTDMFPKAEEGSYIPWFVDL